jgi:hypothetical protein
VTPRSLIFISAVSRELRSARQLVANTLTFLGYEPVWQDIFATEGGDLREVLRARINQCNGVVQLVGQYYGAEPPTSDQEFGRVSYTQYEALYGRKHGKKVWYLFIDETFPRDPCEEEAAELQQLQAAYRRRLQSDTHVFHPLTSNEALEASVLKLRDDLSRLRRGAKQWAVVVIALLLFLVGAVVWLLQAQRHQTGVIQKQGEQVTAIVSRYQKMEQALVRLAAIEAQAKQPGEKITSEEQRARAYGVLEKELGLPAGTLAKELPAFALELYSRADSTPLMRARAAYALNKFDEAEKLSLEGADQDQKAYETTKHVGEERRKAALEAYELAGQSADQRIQYADALGHLHKAEMLTDRRHDPLEWARVQFGIAQVLYDQGQYQQAERTLRDVLQERVTLLGLEHPETLKGRTKLANALWAQGRYREAESEHREVLRLKENAAGSEDPETLNSRNGLARVLESEGKYGEAEAECRGLIKIEEQSLGPKHPETLKIRSVLANVLDEQGKYAQAETEIRSVIKLRQEVFGPEHPQTLNSRNDLAIVFDEQGKHGQAEVEFRAVAELRGKVLGPEHPDTLGARNNLVVALTAQDKFEDAEKEARNLLNMEERTLAADSPFILSTRNNLVEVLGNEGKYAEAEQEARATLQLRQKAHGSEHPETLRIRINLADILNQEGKYREAEDEARPALDAREKILGAEHPDTLHSRYVVANALEGQGKYAEAESEYRFLVAAEEKIVGVDGPDTLSAYYRLALCLHDEGKNQEAKESAMRAAKGAVKILGPDYPDTKKYQKLLADLESKP